MKDDAELLRSYTAEHSEAAFTELVHRHIDLVYGAALRRTSGDRHLAADVAQQVFTRLARDARQLSRHPVLCAWLHTATRNAALNLVISEQRRRTREREAGALEVAFQTQASPEWERMQPLLDAAIDELQEPDRVAVILRFLERRSFAQIGAVLRVTEDAARMRTDRALDKLRLVLARRGITSTAAALAAIVASQPLTSAPAGLAATLAPLALSAASAGAGLVAFLSSLMTSKIIATAALSGALAFAAGGYLGLNHASQAPLPPAPELPQHSQTIAALRNQVAQLRADRDQLSTANSKLTAELRATRTTPKSVAAAPQQARSISTEQSGIRQRAVLNNLRQLASAVDQFSLENKRPPTSLDELVGEKKYIRQLSPVDGENYSGVSLLSGQMMTVMTAEGISITYDPSGVNTTKVPPAPPNPARERARELARSLTLAVEKAQAAYQAANGRPAATPEALLPYFATPQEGADFVEALEAQKENRR